MAAKIAEEIWLDSIVEVITPGHAFNGLRGTIVKAFRDRLVVDIPVGREKNQLTLTAADLAVV